ncbi:MAG: DUF4832 domain-containing protein [Pseudomonadota bacterium]
MITSDNAKANDFDKTIEIATESLTQSAPLANAGYGLVIPNYRPGSNDQPGLKSRYPFAEIVYKRFLWSELEPEEGEYNFSILEKWINGWKNRGYRIGFGVMSTTDGKQATPAWVFKAGVPGVAHMNGQQIDPVMWNDTYHDKLEKFIAALGERLGGGRAVEFMDIRGIGMWGEMHFGFGINGMWTQDELYDHGLSEDTLKTAYFRQMEYYKKAFPHTNLFLNISPGQKRMLQSAPHLKIFFLPRKNADYQRHTSGKDKPFILPVSEQITERAVALGIGLRSDGLIPQETVSSKITAGYFHDYCFPGGPVKCFYEFAISDPDPDEINRMLNFAVRDHVSYININFRKLSDMTSETVRLLKDTAMKIGYHFYLVTMTIKYPSHHFFNRGPVEIKINHTWMNKGNIAPPADFSLQFVLLDRGHNIIFDSKVIPSTPVSGWLPEKTIPLESQLNIPSTLQEGQYTLAVRMHDQLGNFVNLHLMKRPNDQFYPLAVVEMKQDNAGQRVVQISSLPVAVQQ